MDIQDNYSTTDRSITNHQARNSAHKALLSRKRFSVKSDAFSYKRINGNLSCSVNFSSNQVDAVIIAEQATALLSRLLRISLQHKKLPSQIECYLYSPENQVHVLSFGFDSSSHQNDCLIDLVKTRISQLKLVFSINRMELNCDQSEILAQAIQ